MNGSTVAETPCGRCGATRAYLKALLLAGGLYVLTVAPGPLWQDSGLAQNRTLAHDFIGPGGLALSHPLYYLLTISFQNLPFHESAYKTNLVSVVFGAVTVANVVLLIGLLTGRWGGAAIGGMSLAVAHTFWQHCALAEVYTVTTALLTAEALCVRQFLVTRKTGWLCLLFLCNGLGTSNHMLASLSLLCDLILICYAVQMKYVGLKSVPILALCWLCGASIYLFLIVSRIASGAGITDTIRSALVGGYGDRVLNILPTRRMLMNSLLYIALNFPTPLILLPICFWVSRGKRNGPESTGGVNHAIGWYLAGATTLYLVWAVRYNVPDQYTFFIPFYVLLAIWIGWGADAWLARYGRRWMAGLVVAAVLPAMIYLPLPIIAQRLHLPLGLTRDVPFREPYRFFLWPWKTGYDGAERFAYEVEKILPDGALLLADSTTVRPIQYLRATGRWHRAVSVYPQYAGLDSGIMPTREALQAVLASDRVYVVSPIPNYCPEWLLDACRFEPTGIIFRAIARGSPSTQPSSIAS